MAMDIINRSLEGQSTALKEIVGNPDKVQQFVLQLVDVFNRGGKLIVAGSARMGSVANLVANIFLHRLDLERPLLPAYSLCHDVTLHQTLDRDGLGSQVFVRQFRALASEGDVLLVFGDLTSDKSMTELLTAASEEGCLTAAVLPKKLVQDSEKPDILFPLITTSSARAAESALFFGHLLCEMVEGELFGI